MPKKTSRFRKRDSDRSGFTYLRRQLVKDEGFLVGPDEFDRPPPSKKPLGGEGDVSAGFIRSNHTSFATPDENIPKVQLISATGGISSKIRFFNASGEALNNGLLQVAASDTTVDISKDPQISPGRQNQMITVEGVSNKIVLQDGNGLSMPKHFLLDSGALINFIYHSGNAVWKETSRSHKTKSLGEL